MSRVLYNIFLAMIVSAFVIFIGYCWNEYRTYNVADNLFYIVMSVIAILVVCFEFKFGGSKSEKN
jgi:hypothetical protein